MQETIYRSDPYTFVKHKAYAHYLNCWSAKLLQRFERASLVDAFAGAGIYTDGEPGSTIVCANTILKHLRLPNFRGELGIISLEARADRADELIRQVSRLPHHPKISVDVCAPAPLVDAFAAVDKKAHNGDVRTPTLWLLDSYGPKTLPWQLVRNCMDSGIRDEAIITFFAKEMHQRRHVHAWQVAMQNHFGDDRWRGILNIDSQVEAMEQLVDAYCDSWRERGLFASRFGIRVPSESTRYYLVFLTHAEHGLECWAKMARRMDAYTGTGASPSTLDHPVLFEDPSTVRMRALLTRFEGQEIPWRALSLLALEAAQTDRVLRTALSELQEAGLAFRVFPLDADTPWPTGCSVRFYSKTELDQATQTAELP